MPPAGRVDKKTLIAYPRDGAGENFSGIFPGRAHRNRCAAGPRGRLESVCAPVKRPRKDRTPMKKLLALSVVAGLLALVTGCPPSTTPPAKSSPPAGGGMSEKEKEAKEKAAKEAKEKADKEKADKEKADKEKKDKEDKEKADKEKADKEKKDKEDKEKKDKKTGDK
jgi:hypothetical protein